MIEASRLVRPFERENRMDQRIEVSACLDELASRSQEATLKGAQAFGRLLNLAENPDSGQVRRVALFLAAVYNGQAFPLDPFELRAVNIAISDDMLRCLDALRSARADLHTLVPDGDARVRAVVELWGLRWPARE
jgi:hypothetical protein